LTTGLSSRWIVTLILANLLVVPLEAEEIASIVFGSYGSLASAESSRQLLESRLAEPLEIVAVDIRGTRYFRILSSPDNNMARVRNQLAKIKSSVNADAWLFIRTSESESLVNESDSWISETDSWISETDSRSSELDSDLAETVSQVATRSSQPSSPSASASSSTLKNVPSNQPKYRSFARLPGYQREAASSSIPESYTTIASIKTSPSSVPVVIKPVPSGGIDATEEPLILPKFGSVEIDVDGLLDEKIWSEVQGYNNMTVIEPDTLIAPRYGTELRFLYTDEGFYMGVLAEQPTDKLIARLSSRDVSINRDGVFLTLDTSGRGLYGFFFGVNLGGTLWDGTVLPEWQFSQQWDGPWQGNAVPTESGYSVEMFLPWSMMAMPEAPDLRKMGFYVSRKVAYLDERWAWPALAYSKAKFMSGLQPIQMEKVTPRRQFTGFPFTAVTRNNIHDETDYRAGFDLFWRPSSNLQLTATVNPDFGTVESDDVVINLTAFETFFPEKRLFFLEGNEIFITSPRSTVMTMSSGGGARGAKYSYSQEPTSLVNTRRIGGPAPSPHIPAGITVAGVELGKPTELSGALKLTGQKGSFRYGALAAFEEDSKFRGYQSDGTPYRIEQDGRDFSVIRFLYENTNRGRRSLGWISTLTSHSAKDAVVHGIDAHYLNPTGKLYWDGQLIFSDVGEVEGFGGFWDLSYSPSQGRFHRLSLDYFDDKLNVDDFGYIRRNDSINLRYTNSFTTSQSERFRLRSSYWVVNQEYNTNGRAVRSMIYWMNRFTLHNRSQVSTEIDFYPAQWDDRNSYGKGDYRIQDRWGWYLSYGSDSSKKISVSTSVSAKQEDLRDWTYTYKNGITLKPNDRFSLDLDIAYRERHGWVIYQGGQDFTSYNAIDWQPQLAVDFFFTARQQLRLTLQWAGINANEYKFYQVPPTDGDLIEVNKGSNDPSDDFTISRLTSQLRYRWEIAPLSDLFVVYTRGGNLPNRIDDEFGDLFHDVLTEPIIDLFVIKLRYRFGR